MHVHASKYVFDNACGIMYMYMCVLMFVCVYICNYVNVQFVSFFVYLFLNVLFFVCLLSISPIIIC